MATVSTLVPATTPEPALTVHFSPVGWFATVTLKFVPGGSRVGKVKVLALAATGSVSVPLASTSPLELPSPRMLPHPG